MLFTGELLRQAERHLSEGLHPRVLTEGFELAKEHVLKVLDEFRASKPGVEKDRELLESVARTSLRTKLREEIADKVGKSLELDESNQFPGMRIFIVHASIVVVDNTHVLINVKETCEAPTRTRATQESKEMHEIRLVAFAETARILKESCNRNRRFGYEHAHYILTLSVSRSPNRWVSCRRRRQCSLVCSLFCGMLGMCHPRPIISG